MNYVYEPEKIVEGLPIGYSEKGLKQLRRDAEKGYWETVDEYDEDEYGNLIVVGKTERYVNFVHIKNLNFKIVSETERKEIERNPHFICASEYGFDVVVQKDEIGCLGIYRILVK